MVGEGNQTGSHSTGMRIYQNSYHCSDGHKGYTYHASLRDAKRQARESKERTKDEGAGAIDDVTTTAIGVTPTKRGIISALNLHAGHNDNG